MPRVNIYLPNEVYALAERWRDSASLSEICARAIKDEFDAREVHRTPPSFLESLRPPSELEAQLAAKYNLQEVFISGSVQQLAIHDVLGELAAKYLDRVICDGAYIGIAGGRQTWSVVRRLSPRRVRTVITALGLHHADPKLLHVHPNSLATFLWLLYSPRSEAHIIGESSASVWNAKLPKQDHPVYFILGSCNRFDPSSPFANLVGTGAKYLLENDVLGDFAYAFLDHSGRPLSPPFDGPKCVLSHDKLKVLAKRSDARVVMVAGGKDKVVVLKAVLAAGLCNVLITDEASAIELIH